jgi:hypothetical protein
VHACLEVCITTTETLQATAYLHTLFEHSHLVTMLRQDTATGQSSKSTTDYYTLLHYSLFTNHYSLFTIFKITQI